MNYTMKMTPNHHFMLNGLPMEPVSRTYQYRKIMKPMLERKRRARINKCLDELKDLMTGTLQADGENVSKLEKADILELTVRHLHRLRESNALFLRRNETISMDKFWAGFQHCAAEVSQFLNKYDRNISGDLIKYIANYIPNIATATAAAAAVAASTNVITTSSSSLPSPPSSSSSPSLSSSIKQDRLQPYSMNQFPLGGGNKPPQSVKLQATTYEYECYRREARASNAATRRVHPYARDTVSTGDEATLSDGDISDGDSSGGVWRPW